MIRKLKYLTQVMGVCSAVLASSHALGQSIHKAPVAPTIDGAVDEVWEFTPEWQLTIKADQFEANDLSATARVIWDENAIYYLVAVMDDELSDDSAVDLAWQDDSVEIYIDGGNEKAGSYDGNDAQITLRRTMSTVAQGGSVANYIDHITWATTEMADGAGYYVELAISADGIPQALEAGTRIGIEFQVNDDDDGEGSDGNIKLFDSGPSWRNPSLFASATLEDTLVGPTIAKTNTAPAIDGAADIIWDFVTPWELTLRTENYEPNDLRANAKVMWDENNLYYMVTVMDDELSDDSEEALAWQDDSVEIYIDGGNEKAGSYDDNDAQITLRRTMSTAAQGGSVANYIDHITWATSEIDGGYIVELAIAADGIPQALAAGIQIGIEFQINDDDDGDGNDGNIKLFDNGSSWRNPSLFASATLIDDLVGPTIYRPVTSPAVDGSPDFIWDFVPAWPFTINAGNYEPNDLSAYAKVVWDDENVYYLVTVMDDELSDDSAADLAWQDDSVEIYIDGGMEKAGAYDDNDAQITLRRTMSTVAQGGSVANYIDDITWATTEMADGVGYYVELAIPLSAIPQEITAGSNIGIEFQVNDDDDGEGSDGNIKVFNSGASWRNPSLFADATLSGDFVGPKIYRAEVAPVVDGDVDPVWDTFSGSDVEVGAQNFEPNDLSGNAKILWDDENIYYLVTVMDDELSDDSAAADAWMDDSVEIYIDGGNEKASAYDDNDAQLTLRRTMSTGVQGGSNENYADDITWATSEMPGGVGYYVEMSLPLSALPQEVVADMTRIGTEVQINDDDDGGGNDGNIRLFRSGPAFRDPSIFTEALFSSELPPEPTTPPPPDPVLMITGVLDGPLGDGLPRVIELYALEDIEDLAEYGIGTSTDGGGSEGEEFTLSGSVSAGSYIHIATEAVEFENVFGAAPTFADAVADIDGNDAVELFFMGGLVDIFGAVDQDATGTVWDYSDSWAYRLDTATGPSATLDLEEWYFAGADSLDDKDAAGVLLAVPFGTFPAFDGPSIDPLLPWADAESGDTVFSPWFGLFEVGADGWIKHSELGWLYIGDITSSESMWMYSLYWNVWLWTSMDHSPALYHSVTGDFIIYFILEAGGESIGAYIFNYSTGAWSFTPAP